MKPISFLNILPKALLAGLLLAAAPALAQFKVIGYLPSWTGDVNAVQYDKLTHINYAFLLPNADGSLRPIENPTKLQSLVATAHAKGVKVLVSVGGWMNDGNPTEFASIGGNATYTKAFTTNLISFASQYNLDGIDIDWEHPTATTANGYAAVMQDLATQLHSRGKLLTTAVAGGTWAGPSILSSALSSLDLLNIMAYDDTPPAHSTYNLASQSIAYWRGRGLAAGKIVLGVPFYGQAGGETYASLLSRGADPNADLFNGIGYNGIPTIKSKTNLAFDQAGGIMIWQLAGDAVGANSLLTAINQVVVARSGTTPPPPPAGNAAPTVSLTSPAGGASFVAPAAITLSANAADANGTVSKVEFFRGSTLLGTDTSAPYAYAWTGVAAGTYSLTAKATDNAGATTTSAAVSITVTSGGGGTCPMAAWSAAATYVGGNQASRNGSLYTAKWWTQGEDPATASCPDCVWKLVGPCGSARGSVATTALQAPAAELTLYPNPATDQLQLSAAQSLTGSRFEVLDARGRVMLQGSAAPGLVSVAGLPAGLYVLRLTVAGQAPVTRRFAK